MRIYSPRQRDEVGKKDKCKKVRANSIREFIGLISQIGVQEFFMIYYKTSSNPGKRWKPLGFITYYENKEITKRFFRYGMAMDLFTFLFVELNRLAGIKIDSGSIEGQDSPLIDGYSWFARHIS